MKFESVKKIDEGGYFVVNTLDYLNQITPFDLTLATQTISFAAGEKVLSIETPTDDQAQPLETTTPLSKDLPLSKHNP